MVMTALAARARPLEDDWKDAIDGIARARNWPTSDAPAQLGALVRALSDAYNAPPGTLAAAVGPGRAVASSAPAIAARLGFSFARDVPKSAAAVRELVAAGELGRGDTLRVLDLGAGLGATTWGVARAIAAAGSHASIDALWVDEDAMALDVATSLVRAREGRADPAGHVRLTVRTERRRATSTNFGGPFDLVLAGQVLSELDPALEDDERALRHADWLGSLVGALTPGGALVVIEPALRDRTRHLHAVRDMILTHNAASVFAPCLHASACPALAVEGDWCHEDVDVDLPAWLVPVARAAGLRWQGLTFSYLVLRKAGARTLVDHVGGGDGRLTSVRVISGAIVSKGKREHFVCGADAARARVTRLDREHSESNATWDELGRGDVVSIDPPPDPKKPRVMSDSRVSRLEPGSSAAGSHRSPRS